MALGTCTRRKAWVSNKFILKSTIYKKMNLQNYIIAVTFEEIKTLNHKCFGFSNVILQLIFSYYLPISFLCMFTRGYDSYQLFPLWSYFCSDSNLDGLYSTIKCKTNNPANKLFKFSFAGFYFIFTLKSNEPNSSCLSKNVLSGKTR